MNPLIIAASEKRRNLGQTIEALLGRNLVKGDANLGYFGEFTAAEVVTGSGLSDLVGIRTGTLMTDNVKWLGFALDGKRLLVAKTPVRHTVSWNTLNAYGVVKGSKTVSIAGLNWKVRLFKGASADPVVGEIGNYQDSVVTHGSEWNRLMYRVVGKDHIPSATSEGDVGGEFASFTNTDLAFSGDRPGRLNVCQERMASNSDMMLCRGMSWVTDSSELSVRIADSGAGWRPVLELVE